MRWWNGWGKIHSCTYWVCSILTVMMGINWKQNYFYHILWCRTKYCQTMCDLVERKCCYYKDNVHTRPASLHVFWLHGQAGLVWTMPIQGQYFISIKNACIFTAKMQYVPYNIHMSFPCLASISVLVHLGICNYRHLTRLRHRHQFIHMIRINQFVSFHYEIRANTNSVHTSEEKDVVCRRYALVLLSIYY